MLRNEGLLNRHWHDRMIDPGDKWDETIQRELAEADVIIVMASATALSTDYITDHEIPKALELHDAGEAVVVPIVLDACRWEKTSLGGLAKVLNNLMTKKPRRGILADGFRTATISPEN